jgi:predicted helicase
MSDLGVDSREWKIALAQADINKSGLDKERVKPIAYRPFDIRYTYWTGTSRGFQSMARARAMQHIIDKGDLPESPDGNGNMVLVYKRGFINDAAVGFVTQYISESRFWSCSGMQGADFVSPLYTYGDGLHGGKEANFTPDVVSQIEKVVGKTTPESIFYYIYAVLHSPSYCEKYREFLKTDFPRIPYPEKKGEFTRLSAVGEKLANLHLMKVVPESTVSFTVSGSDKVEKIRFEECRVYINETQYFDNVPQIAWDFFIGGYKPAQKYLEYRKGRKITMEEVEHYERIIAVLVETGRIVSEEVDG